MPAIPPTFPPHRLGRLALHLALGLMVVAGLTSCQSTPEEDSTSYRIFVGTGTGEADEGIYTFRFDGSSGALTPVGDVTPIMNPSYLTLSPNGQHLYSVRETSDSATVRAYDVHDSTGELTLLNEVSAAGSGPCYVSTDAAGDWVFVANYVSGTVAMFPVADDGSLEEAVDVAQHQGSSVHPERQTGPHAHYADVDPQNRFALSTDLGIDRLHLYPLDTERGSLNEQNAREVSVPPGTGPRHLDFHPSGEYVYVLGELNGTVMAFRYGAEEGQMEQFQTVSTLPDTFSGSNKSADIHVHPSGELLYASNRGDSDSIVMYSIDEETGRLSLIGRQREHVRWPRNFAISPSGRFLLVANRRANTIVVFRIDPNSGQLAPTGQSVEVPEPTRIAFGPAAGE